VATLLERYPRRLGVIIPRALVPLCRSNASLWNVERRDLSDQTDERRALVGAMVVETVRRRFADLPREIGALSLPDPDAALGGLLVGAPTRKALLCARGWKTSDSAWTVDRYVAVPSFGARSLVDLLAAREEAAAGGSARAEIEHGRVEGDVSLPIDPARLEEVSRFLEAHLPLPSPELGPALQAAGLAARPVSPEEIVRSYETYGRPAPFRLVRRGGAEIATTGPAQEIASAIISTATSFISWWGMGTVQSVMARVGTLKSAPHDAGTIRRVLAGIPQLRWLDESREWFSLRSGTNRLTILVRKVFTFVSRIARGELIRTLLKGQIPGFHPPAPVLERYLADVADCRFEGEFVRPRPAEQALALTAAERVLIDALRAGGGELPMTHLKSNLRSELPPWKIRHTVDSSPLFLRSERGTVRLIAG